jgi:hypothetical protein
MKTSWQNSDIWGLRENNEDFLHLINFNFTLYHYSKSGIQLLPLPISVHFEKRFQSEGQLNWYLIKLEKKLDVTNFINNQLVIRPKAKNIFITKGKKEIVAVFLIKNEEEQKLSRISRKNLLLAGWCIIK